jgi:pimeloyl-ACP methyl ester carboxylesterase
MLLINRRTILGIGALIVLSALILLILELGFNLLTWSPSRTPPFKLKEISQESKANFEWMGLTQNPLIHFSIPYTDVSFPSRFDSVPLKGWHILSKKNPKGAPCQILFVHGRGTDRRTFLKHLNYIPQTGCDLLMFDNRNHGESGPKEPGTSLGVFEKNDVLGAVDYLASQSSAPIYILGTSLGGAASIYAAQIDVRIQKLIIENTFSSAKSILSDFNGPTVSSFRPIFSSDYILNSLLEYSQFRLGIEAFPNPKDVIASISPRPVFFIHSQTDLEIPVHHSIELFNSALDPKLIWTPAQGRHSSVYNENSTEYSTKVLEFFAH